MFKVRLSLLALISAAIFAGVLLMPQIFALVSGGLQASPTLTSGNYGPPTRIPPSGASGIDAEPDSLNELQVLSGHGSEQARNAFKSVLQSLPFTPHLPNYLPSGMELYHVAGNLEGKGKDRVSSFSAYYIKQTPTGRIDLHTFQTDEKIDRQNVPAEARMHRAEVKPLKIGSKEWTYRLLVFPQPDSSEVRMHHVERTFEDGLYVSFYIQAGGGTDSQQLLDELVKVAGSAE